MNFKQWIVAEEETDSRVNDLVAPFVFFFTKDKELFGAGEDSRVVFAKMKHPDDELPSGWKEEANFSAHNLKKSVSSDPSQNIFSHKDLKSIKIIDKDKAVNLLRKEVKKLGDKAFPKQKPTFNLIDLSRFAKTDSDDAPNFDRTDEE